MSASTQIQNPYSELLASNPSKIFTKGTDKRNRRMQALTAEAEFESDLALLDYQNEYNSDSAKAERMRMAGLNPDLLGTSGSSDSAGSSGLVGNLQMTPDDNPADKAQKILGLIGSGSGLMESAFNTASQYEEMRSKSLDNDMKQLNLVSSLQGLKDQSDTEDELSRLLYDRNNSGGLSVFYDSLGNGIGRSLKGRTKRIWNKLGKRMSAYTSGREAFSRSVDASLNAGKSLSKGNFYSESGDYGTGVDVGNYSNAFDAITKFEKALSEISLNANMARDSADIAKAGYTEDYYNASSGSVNAGYDTSTLGANAQTAGYGAKTAKRQYDEHEGDAALNKAFSELVKDLQAEDSVFSKTILSLVWALRSGTLGNAVDILGSAASNLTGMRTNMARTDWLNRH